MKAKKRLVVVLVAIIALILSGIGIWGWNYYFGDKITPFKDGKNHLKTRSYENHTIYELDIEGYQDTPTRSGAM
ncbi:MAG: hypothetical protein R2883_05220 [Caldisericia bacterium]